MVPVGIAAGMLRDPGHLDRQLLGLVDHITLGSFTNERHTGNKEPVWWFSEEDRSSINAVNLDNLGIEHFLDNWLHVFATIFQGTLCRIHISVAPLKSGDTGEMLQKLESCQFKTHIMLVEINAACPNHRDTGGLHPVLANDPEAVESLMQEAVVYTGPKALKIAPDMEMPVLQAIVELCRLYDFAAIVSGNARKGSSVIGGIQRLSVEMGGVGGMPLLSSAVGQVRALRKMIDKSDPPGSIELIGCGGILDADAVRTYEVAGADKVQVATYFRQYGIRGIQDLMVALHT